MLGHRLGEWAQRLAGHDAPWTNVYGLARTLLAVSTLVTLLTNDAGTLFIPLAMSAVQPPFCDGQLVPGAFCIVDDLEVARWFCIAILVLVASGWRPRITGVLHWWVAMSLQTSATLLDGGDQVAMNLTLLLVPITLCDPRRSHWSTPSDTSSPASRLVAATAFVAIRVQVAIIYYVAGVAKYAVEEWSDGTALYYWLSHPVFGAPDFLRGPVDAVIHSPVLLPIVTWSVLVLEALLAAALFMRTRHRMALFGVAATFHLGIALMHGILTFAIAMEAALVLYLLPPTATLEQLAARVRAAIPRRGALVRATGA